MTIELFTSRPSELTASSAIDVPAWGLPSGDPTTMQPRKGPAGAGHTGAQVLPQRAGDEEEEQIDERQETQAQDPQAEREDIH